MLSAPLTGAPAAADPPSIATDRGWIVTGVGGGSWRDAAEGLGRAWAAAGVGVEPLSVADVAQRLARPQGIAAGVLVLVEAPADALAAALEAQPLVSHDAVLDTWAATAATALRGAQRGRERWVFVAQDTLRHAPAALAPAFEAAGLPAPPALPPAASPAVLWRWAAAARAQAHAASRRLHAELRASLASVHAASGDDPTEATDALSALQSLLSAHADERERLEGALREAEAEVAAARAAQDARRALEQALADSRAEVDLLVQQLLQTQNALQQTHRSADDLRRAGENSVGIEGREAAQAQLTLKRVHDTPPHRHLHLLVPQLRAGQRVVHKLEARLVEHAGQPGLVIFAPADGAPAISAWTPQGQEGGRAYMLLVPGDPAGRDLLSRLGTSDWNVVSVLARAIQRDLAAGKLAAPPGWGAVATRLVSLLDDLSQRLRYDRLDVAALPGPAPGLELTLRHAALGPRDFDDIRLRWQPDAPGDGPALSWAAPAPGRVLPLPHWPVDADGAPLAWYPLPLGGAGAAGRLRWSRLGDAGQTLVLAVLETLHAAAQAAPVAGEAGVIPRERLLTSARTLNRQARRTHAWVRLRQALPRLRRGAPAA